MKKIIAAAAVAMCLLPVFSQNVSAYYTFDDEYDDSGEITSVIDHSGNSLDADTGCLDGSEFDDGYEGQGLVFNGTDEFVMLDKSLLSGKGFTFCAWICPQEWRAWMRVLDIGNQIEDLWIGMDGETGKLRMDVVGQKLGKNGVKVLAPLPEAEEWTHIAATIDGKAAKLYVNGKLMQRIPCPITPAMLQKNVQGLFVGASNWGSDPLFNGIMDNVFVADRALSASEISSIFKGVKNPEIK